MTEEVKKETYVDVHIGYMGDVRLTPRYDQSFHVASLAGGLLFKDYLYPTTMVVLERNGLIYAQNDCKITNRNSCTVPKKIRDAIVAEVTGMLREVFHLDPTILRRLRHIKWESAVQTAKNQIAESRKYMVRYQDEVDQREAFLADLMKEEP